PTSKGPPSSLVQLRIAVWTGNARDTRPTPVISPIFWTAVSVVIGDGADDGGEGSPGSHPDQFTDESHIGACDGSPLKFDQRAAKAREAEQERQPKNLPAMTVSQFPASSKAGQGPEPLDNASRQPNKPHRVENQARDDQKGKPQKNQDLRDKCGPD